MRRLAGMRNHGLSIVFGLRFLGALTGQALAGVAGYNERALDSGLPSVDIGAYLTASELAVDVAENWQSEFLAVGSMVVLSIFLRERGSPESKPVGAPHSATGTKI